VDPGDLDPDSDPDPQHCCGLKIKKKVGNNRSTNAQYRLKMGDFKSKLLSFTILNLYYSGLHPLCDYNIQYYCGLDPLFAYCNMRVFILVKIAVNFSQLRNWQSK